MDRISGRERQLYYVVLPTLSSTNCRYRLAVVKNMMPEAMPNTVRRASTRGSKTFVTAQNIILPRLNSTEPQMEYTTRHGWTANRMCLRLYKYTPKPTCEFSNNAFCASSSYGANTLQNSRQNKHLKTEQSQHILNSLLVCEMQLGNTFRAGCTKLSYFQPKVIFAVNQG